MSMMLDAQLPQGRTIASTRNTRVRWVDDVKLFACILVVLGHFFQSMQSAHIISDSPVLQWFDRTIYFFHVPLFFICSGYLYLRAPRKDTPAATGGRILHRIVSLGIPYIIFSVITWLLKAVLSSSVNNPSKFSLLETLFLEPLSPYWYLYVLLLFQLLIPRLRSFKGILALLITAAVLSIGCDLLPLQSTLLIYLSSNMVWFVAGMFLASVSAPPLSHRLMLIIGALLGAVFIALSVFVSLQSISFPGLSSLMGLLGCTATLLVFSSAAHSSAAPSKSTQLASLTYPIFMLHTLFAAPVRILLQKLGINAVPIHIAAGLAISFIGPVLTLYISRLIKPVDFMLYPQKYIHLK